MISILREKLLATLLVFISIFNIFISSHHFGHERHVINPETGKIEHRHSHIHNDHAENFIPFSYLSTDHESHEKHEVCNVLDSMLKQLLGSKAQTISNQLITETPYTNYCRESLHSSAEILSFAPKLSPPLV